MISGLMKVDNNGRDFSSSGSPDLGRYRQNIRIGLPIWTAERPTPLGWSPAVRVVSTSRIIASVFLLRSAIVLETSRRTGLGVVMILDTGKLYHGPVCCRMGYNLSLINMIIPEIQTIETDRTEALDRIGKEFPNPDLEVTGIYTNGRMVDTLGPELIVDFLGSFSEEAEADPEMFRIALSELSDVVIYSMGDEGSDGRWRLLDTREHIGWDERGKILMEMSEAERVRYEGLFGSLVRHYYWKTEQDWLNQLSYRESLPFAELQKLRLELPEQ